MSSKKDCLKKQLQKTIEIYNLPYQIALVHDLQKPPLDVILNLQQKMFTQILPLYSELTHKLLRDMISNKDNFESAWKKMCEELDRCTREIDLIEEKALRSIVDDVVVQDRGGMKDIWNQCQKRITDELPLHKKIPILSQSMSKCLGGYVSHKDEDKWKSFAARYFKEQNIILLDESKRESKYRRCAQNKNVAPYDDASKDASKDVSDDEDNEMTKKRRQPEYRCYNTLSKGEVWVKRRKPPASTLFPRAEGKKRRYVEEEGEEEEGVEKEGEEEKGVEEGVEEEDRSCAEEEERRSLSVEY